MGEGGYLSSTSESPADEDHQLLLENAEYRNLKGQAEDLQNQCSHRYYGYSELKAESPAARPSSEIVEVVASRPHRQSKATQITMQVTDSEAIKRSLEHYKTCQNLEKVRAVLQRKEKALKLKLSMTKSRKKKPSQPTAVPVIEVRKEVLDQERAKEYLSPGACKIAPVLSVNNATVLYHIRNQKLVSYLAKVKALKARKPQKINDEPENRKGKWSAREISELKLAMNIFGDQSWK